MGPPADKNYFYIQSGTGDVYLRQSPSKNPSVSQYVVSQPFCFQNMILKDFIWPFYSKIPFSV